ncbi:MAG: RNase adapter RapZ [bacterium]|nr:RNase adapter RapZ [bacterium]MYD05049.1 RNase adapter RapZ [Acidimicrobiia bacterium]MCY3652546.1 RNase adapter RapZ [bacterium]MDE0643883.1 RNase adapter RapZ [bacterium]MYF26422.1 RNase adapter RapZ [Acidimicrobiia bacterium]
MADPDTTPSTPVMSGSRLLLLTGLSGAGRSTGAKVLEDLGFYVIDNLPPALLRQAVSLNEQQSDGRHLAVVLDSRGGIPIAELETHISELEQTGIRFNLVFLDSEDDALIRRYEEHRRPHPLGLPTLAESIAAERDMMSGLRLRADMYVNTSETNVHQLREWFESHLSALVEEQTVRLGITSFGFKNGTPRDSDLLFDVRFLPNPHWDRQMRSLTGTDQEVRDYVLSGRDAQGFLNRIHDLLSFLIPLYQESGRSYVSIGIGCTGGRHRSVAVAEELGRWLVDKGYSPTVLHRDIE